METDTPNINNAAHDNMEWWNAKKAEHKARIATMKAEEKMATNDAFQDLSTEVEGAAEWTEAQWDGFKAKVSKWWNAGEVAVDESI